MSNNATYIRTGEALAPLLNLTDMATQLRIAEPAPEDNAAAELLAFGAAAYAWIERWLGRTLIATPYELWCTGFPYTGMPIKIMRLPVIAIDALSYTDAQGVVQTFDIASLDISLAVSATYAAPACIYPPATGWPCDVIANRRDAVRVCFTAGFGEAPSDVPAPIKQAALLLVSDFYDRRGLTGMASMDSVGVPPAITALLQPYRVYLP